MTGREQPAPARDSAGAAWPGPYRFAAVNDRPYASGAEERKNRVIVQGILGALGEIPFRGAGHQVAVAWR